MSLIDQILSSQPSALTEWGYVLILIVALLEATPIGGIVVPGQTFVILAGVAAKFGVFNFWWVVGLSAFGAIIGDYVGYIIGRKYGYNFLSKYGKYFFFKKEQLEKIKTLMNAHAGKTLIIGRFNSLTRAFAPLIAGTSGIKVPRFAFYGIISGITWAVFYAGLGYIFGHSYEIASKYIGRITLIGLLIIIAGIAAYYFINKKRHIYEKYHMKILAINVTSFYIFFKLMDDVVHGDWITKLDGLTTKLIDAITNPFLTKIMNAVVFLTSTQVFLFIVAIFVFALIWKKNHMQASMFVSSLGVTSILVYIIKEIIQRPRPAEAIIAATGSSFPSWHSALAAAFFLLIIYAFRRKFKNLIARTAFVIMNIFFILVVGFSRLYFHVHYFTDVIAGFAFGISVVTFLLLAFKFISFQMTVYRSSRNKS